jgi:hypothetical protein
MSDAPVPVFVEKRTYRRRRMADAARMMPLLGIGLFLVPLLWRGDGEVEGARTVSVMLYIFLAWVFLAGAAAIISRRLSPGDADPPDRKTG